MKKLLVVFASLFVAMPAMGDKRHKDQTHIHRGELHPYRVSKYATAENEVVDLDKSSLSIVRPNQLDGWIISGKIRNSTVAGAYDVWIKFYWLDADGNDQGWFAITSRDVHGKRAYIHQIKESRGSYIASESYGFFCERLGRLPLGSYVQDPDGNYKVYGRYEVRYTTTLHAIENDLEIEPVAVGRPRAVGQDRIQFRQQINGVIQNASKLHVSSNPVLATLFLSGEDTSRVVSKVSVRVDSIPANSSVGFQGEHQGWFEDSPSTQVRRVVHYNIHVSGEYLMAQEPAPDTRTYSLYNDDNRIKFTPGDLGLPQTRVSATFVPFDFLILRVDGDLTNLTDTVRAEPNTQFVVELRDSINFNNAAPPTLTKTVIAEWCGQYQCILRVTSR